MLKYGRFRAIRNIPVGWLLQAIHSTDRSERIFRIALELVLFTCVFSWFLRLEISKSPTLCAILAFLVVHTVCWALTGNFWVYILDSFSCMRNPGLDKILTFVVTAKKLFEWFDSSNTILIYGSMCRSQFHMRSDLDLRVVRKADSLKGFLAIPIAFILRAYSFFILLPVDLQVVDSMEFLRRQMRRDEIPIVVCQSTDFLEKLKGRKFADVLENPESVLRQA